MTGATKGPVAVIGGTRVGDGAGMPGGGRFSMSECRGRLGADLLGGFSAAWHFQDVVDDVGVLMD